MTDLLLPCWYRAVEVPGPREQKALFGACQTLLATLQGTLTVNTYMAAGRYYAILFSLDETSPPEHEQKRIEAAFAPYTPFLRLDETFLDALVRARLSKEPEIAAETRHGRIHVSRKQRPITFTDPAQIELSEEERVQRQQSWIATIEALLAEGRPFVEIFKMTFAAEQIVVGSPLVQHADPLKAAMFRQMLEHAQLWLWTDSARKMCQDLARVDEDLCLRKGWTTPEAQLAHYNQLSQDLFRAEQRLWIEFDEPQPSPHGRVRAVFVYPRYPEQELNEVLDPHEDPIKWFQAHQILGQEASRWNIDVIGENASVALRLSYDTHYACWVLLEEQHMSEVFAWIRWLALVTGMLHKRYARTAATPEFPDHVMSYQAKEQVPRVRGKGKPKDKWVTQRKTYIKVAYDLSEKPSIVHMEDERPQKRQNWLTQAHPEDLIYEQRVIDTFTRSYPRRKEWHPPGGRGYGQTFGTEVDSTPPTRTAQASGHQKSCCQRLRNVPSSSNTGSTGRTPADASTISEREHRRKQGPTMLVIRRKTGERIILSGNILIEVLEVNEGRAKLGITAPPEVDIVREELLQRQIPLSQPPVTKPE